jgi:RNA polymerase sigma factor for flagellar operon FliA
VRKNLKDIDAVYSELQNSLGREPTDEEIAEKLNISTTGYHETMSNVYSASILSLEELIADNAVNLIPSTDKTPETDYEGRELTNMMAQAIDALNEKERIIVSLYYYEGLKAKQIAGVLEVSESRVSQLHSKALMKLKFSLQKYMAYTSD